MACTVPPGYTCSPLDNSDVICPEGLYCPWGGLYARMCPGDTWSAVGSTYLESCQDNTSASIAIVITIFLVLLAASFEWDPRPPICVAHMPKYAPVPYCPEQPGKYVCPNPGCPITRCPT